MFHCWKCAQVQSDSLGGYIIPIMVVLKLSYVFNWLTHLVNIVVLAHLWWQSMHTHDIKFTRRVSIRTYHRIMHEGSIHLRVNGNGPSPIVFLAVSAGGSEWGGMDCPLVSVGRRRGLQEEGEDTRPHSPCPAHHHRPTSRPGGRPSSGPIPAPSLTPTTPPWGSR